MVSRAQLTSMKRMGFSDEDYEEFLRAKGARREDIQAHEVTLRKMMETGATGRRVLQETGLGERLGVTERGLGERAGMEIEAARPLRKAKAGYFTAAGGKATGEAESAAWELATAKGLLPGVERQRGRKEELTQQDVDAGAMELEKMERERDLARVPRTVSDAEDITVARPPRKKRPRRQLRPWLKREIFGGLETLHPVTRAFMGVDLPSYLKNAYEYIYPKR